MIDYNQAIVRVEDNGIGMVSRETEDVFQMFMRASERSEIGGIGLYLAKLASEKVGCLLELVYSKTTGTMFELIFPCDLGEVLRERHSPDQPLIDFMEKQTNRRPRLLS